VLPTQGVENPPSAPVGTDRTVSVELVKHGETIFTKMYHMSGLKENGMSNGEVLAAMNKIHNQKSKTL
jgi:hypothetical protein